MTPAQESLFEGWSFTSAFALFDRRGRILLQHRSDDAPTFPGEWGFFGGSLNAGESFRDALFREALEELQIVLSGMETVGSFRYGSARRLTVLYSGPAGLDGEALRRRQREGKGLGFFTEPESSRIPVNVLDREALPIAFRHVGRRILA